MVNPYFFHALTKLCNAVFTHENMCLLRIRGSTTMRYINSHYITFIDSMFVRRLRPYLHAT